ncbi:MAG: DUF362 domain-containing protein [Candidatus Magnetomorum sp.]|nr:DUF362 domain-containing protein [Candidatus Magnetomorum sp.]
MDRREFLKQFTLYSTGSIMMAPIFNIIPSVMAKNDQPQLIVGVHPNYALLVQKTLAPLGGMSAFVKKGDRVVVKPNIGWDRTPEQSANTHPQIVKTLVELALNAGASKVQVFDRTCNVDRLCYTNSGIKQAVESINDKRAVCEFIDDRKFIPVTIQKGKALKEWPFYKDALAADCYINVPVAKHHRLAGLTLGLKNVMGVIGGERGKIHTNMGQYLADMSTVLKPNLTVIDATRILLQNGPQGGNLNDVKILHTLIATTDPVAADAYATTLFGKKPEDIDSTKAAYTMGLGEMNLDKMIISRV